MKFLSIGVLKQEHSKQNDIRLIFCEIILRYLSHPCKRNVERILLSDRLQGCFVFITVFVDGEGNIYGEYLTFLFCGSIIITITYILQRTREEL